MRTIRLLAMQTFRRAGRHEIGLYGAAIAFYTIFSAAPLILISLALITVFVDQQQGLALFQQFLAKITDPDVAHSLIELTHISTQSTSGWWASLVATGVLLFGATTVIVQLQSALDVIFDAPQTGFSITGFIKSRVIGVTLIFLLTLLFLASIALEGSLSFFNTYFDDFIPPILLLGFQIGASVLTISFSVLFFAAIFRILPTPKLSRQPLLVGGAATAILFLAGKYLLGLYLSSPSIETNYKAAGSFIIFLIWVYYSTQILLIGAEFTCVCDAYFAEKEIKTETEPKN